MPHATMAHVVTALLSLLLTSCGATHHNALARAEESTRLALYIQEQSDGTVTHSWRPAEGLDLSLLGTRLRARGKEGQVERVVSRSRDCDAENRQCVAECMKRPLSRGYGHITTPDRGKGGKERYCERQCMQPYLDCTELEKLRPQEFVAVDAALDWLKRNRRALLVGSMVVIAGAVFVVVSVGVGVVILAPAVLLAEATPGTELFMADGAP